MKTNTRYDSAVLVKKDKLYTWNENGPSYDVNNIPNSFNLPDTVIETMGLYIIRRDSALKTKRRIGEIPLQLFASPLEAIDVNYPEDFELAGTNLILISGAYVLLCITKSSLQSETGENQAFYLIISSYISPVRFYQISWMIWGSKIALSAV